MKQNRLLNKMDPNLLPFRPTPTEVSQERSLVSAASRELISKIEPTGKVSEPYPLPTPSTVGPTPTQECRLASEEGLEPWKAEAIKLASILTRLSSLSISALIKLSTSTENDRGPSYEGDHASILRPRLQHRQNSRLSASPERSANFGISFLPLIHRTSKVCHFEPVWPMAVIKQQPEVEAV